MIKVDVSQVDKYERDLKTFRFKALPFATRNTINKAAFESQKEARNGIKERLILRNRFTEQSIRVEKSKTLKMSAQESSVGSIVDYMEDQEFGTTIAKTGKQGVPLATTEASGEGEGVRPRRRLPKKRLKLAFIILSKRRVKAKSKRQKIFLTVKQAVENGDKYVFLDTGRKKAIHRIRGKGRVDKKGRLRGIKMTMLYDLSRKSVFIPKRPWMKPAVEIARRQIFNFYAESLKFQLKRHNIFKD